MQDLAASGATVVRTWFFQSYYDLSSTGQYLPTPSFDAFDRVLNAAAQYGLKVVPILMNEWQDCAPAWDPSDPSAGLNLGFYQTQYDAGAGYGYPLSFLQYAQTMAAHYATDTTIAFWQIGNELENDTNNGTCQASDESQGAKALRSFTDTVTAAVKQVDPNHLVSLGTDGVDQCGLGNSDAVSGVPAENDYAYVHAGGVDLCEEHDYGSPAQPMPALLAETITACNYVGKPLFVGESGIPADVTDSGAEASSGAATQASLDLRAGFFDAKMTAAFAAGVAGYLIWDKEGLPTLSLGGAAGTDVYSVGPATGADIDPTSTLTAGFAPAYGSYPDAYDDDFQQASGSGVVGTTDGWTVGWEPSELTLASSAAEAWRGRYSLALDLTANGYPGAQTTLTTGAADANQITYHVYLPSTAPSGIQVVPYVSDANWNVAFATDAQGGQALTALRPGWNTITMTVPSTEALPLKAIGIQTDNQTGWTGDLYLGDVSW